MFNNKTVNEIWEELGDITIDGNDCIEQSFYDYTAGTDKYEIWQDIEEHFNVSIGKKIETGKWK